MPFQNPQSLNMNKQHSFDFVIELGYNLRIIKFMFIVTIYHVPVKIMKKLGTDAICL